MLSTKRKISFFIAVMAITVISVFASGFVVTAETTGTAFITSMTLKGERNVATEDPGNYAGWIGTRIMIGDHPLKVTALGRICTKDSDSTHNMIIVETVPDTVIIDYIKAVGGTDGQFIYKSLDEEIILKANTSYIIATDIMHWADKWYDGAEVTTTSVATIEGGVLLGVDGWELTDTATGGYGPVNFKYEILPNSSDTSSTSSSAAVSSSIASSKSSSAAASTAKSSDGSSLASSVTESSAAGSSAEESSISNISESQAESILPVDSSQAESASASSNSGSDLSKVWIPVLIAVLAAAVITVIIFIIKKKK